MAEIPPKKVLVVTNILHVDRIPEDSDRDPQTLYVVQTGRPDADHALGEFIGVWSDLERVCSMLIHHLLGTSYPIAGTVFASLSGPNQIRELILALSELRCNPEEIAKLEKLMERFKKLATTRNRLVHGHWSPNLVVEGDDQDRPYVSEFTWQRRYDPTSPNDRKATDDPKNQKLRSSNVFSVPRIYELSQIVFALAREISDYTNEIGCRLYPDGPPW